MSAMSDQEQKELLKAHERAYVADFERRWMEKGLSKRECILAWNTAGTCFTSIVKRLARFEEMCRAFSGAPSLASTMRDERDKLIARGEYYHEITGTPENILEAATDAVTINATMAGVHATTLASPDPEDNGKFVFRVTLKDLTRDENSLMSRICERHERVPIPEFPIQ